MLPQTRRFKGCLRERESSSLTQLSHRCRTVVPHMLGALCGHYKQVNVQLFASTPNELRCCAHWPPCFRCDNAMRQVPTPRVVEHLDIGAEQT